MTATAGTVAARPVAPNPAAGFAAVLRSEFCKLFSVRSTTWTLCAAAACNIVIAALAARFIPGRLSAQDRAAIDVVRLSLAGLHVSQIAFGVLGALTITSEYGTGMIRTTFTAVPRRRVVLAAKTLSFTLTALVTGIASSFAAYYSFQLFLRDAGLRSTIGDAGVLRAVVGGGLYVVVLGLLGLGLGVIIRSGAGTIATLLGVLFVPSILISVLPQASQNTVGPYLPMNAGEQIYIAVQQQPYTLNPWIGLAVFSVYALAALWVGFALINRRDA